MRKAPLELAKPNDVERKKETRDEIINKVLDDNNLVRKRIIEGSGSLLRAISDGLYSTSHYQNEIQLFCIRHLKYLITTNKLPPRLSMFKGNNMLWKDFSANPGLPGFEKVILELVASLFKVKVLLYHISEDGYLHATVFNHKFDKQLEIVRTHGNHFDSLRTKRHMAIAGICQNIILNVIDAAMKDNQNNNTTSKNFHDFNGDNYINFEYNNWLASKEELAKEGLKMTRSRHKKSLSDNFNLNFDQMEEQQIKFYNIFMNNKPPDDFLKLLQKDRKETEDNIALNIDPRYMQEPWHEAPNIDLAIKNYPVSSSNLSPRLPSYQDICDVDTTESNNNNSNNNNNTMNISQQKQSMVFFTDNQDYQQANQITIVNNNNKPSPKQINPQPPGLTPTKYPQKTYSNENIIYTIHTPDKAKSAQQQQQQEIFDFNNDINNNNNNNTSNNNNSSTLFTVLSKSPIFQQFSSTSSSSSSATHSGFPNRKPNSKNPTLPANYGNDYHIIPNMTSDLQFSDHTKSMHFLNGSNDKRKPIILDEGKEKHTGRLKFFDENKNYGFIVMDEDGSDIFVHYDDLQKAGINKEYLKAARMGQVIKLGFSCMKYIGKYDKSRKATDIQLLS